MDTDRHGYGYAKDPKCDDRMTLEIRKSKQKLTKEREKGGLKERLQLRNKNLDLVGI